jgi:hypothetical protein
VENGITSGFLMVTQTSLYVDLVCSTVNKNPEHWNNRTYVEKTENAQPLRTDFTKAYVDMSTTLHPFIGPRFWNTNHMSGIKGRRALCGYWAGPPKRQAPLGAEDGSEKKLLFWVRRLGHKRRPKTPQLRRLHTGFSTNVDNPQRVVTAGG